MPRILMVFSGIALPSILISRFFIRSVGRALLPFPLHSHMISDSSVEHLSPRSRAYFAIVVMACCSLLFFTEESFSGPHRDIVCIHGVVDSFNLFEPLGKADHRDVNSVDEITAPWGVPLLKGVKGVVLISL